MQDRTAEIKKLALVGAVLVALILLGTIIYQATTLRLVAVTPGKNEVSQYTPNVQFQFSKPLQADGLSAVMEPDSAASAFVDGKTVTVNFNPLKVGQTYTITVKGIAGTNGKKIADQYIKFTVKDIPYDKLSAAQKEADINRQNNEVSAQDDKAFDYIPHDTLDYQLTIAKDGDNVIITANLLLSAADARSGRDEAIALYKQEVLDYMTKSGLDPTKYTINYVVVEPSF